ncbi:MAG: porphobilinogen synthase [Candidatus Hydrogenedentota bacterium]|nr:MAG: porphobilinogen synthase [Candidatus Hydrogenedentota bacterium]
MRYPIYRPRRLRANENFRRLVRETTLSIDDLIMPFFVRPGTRVRRKISSMPGSYQLSVDELVKEARKAAHLGIPAVILFGIPEKKDALGSEGYKKNNIVSTAIKAIRDKVDDFIIITDVCLCEYTDHGHCGVVKKKKGGKDFTIDNDATLELLAKMALSHVEAGADMVAPSDMMDGRIGAVRTALDASGFENVPIMAYAAKYASAFYGPFREAAESPPQFGDRRSYQMDPPNTDEALREVALDIEEGADIVMVKPALPYLDVIYRVKQEFGYPVAAYNVSGEFSLVKAAAARNWVDEQKLVLEILTSIKRAGADMILSYYAMEAAGWLT